MKGLNINKHLLTLELSGNRVSDDILSQINEFLVRNKNGDPIMGSKKAFFSPSKEFIEKPSTNTYLKST